MFIRDEVTNVFASACMPLRKWKSNESKLISGSFQSPLDLSMGSVEPNKLLGLDWFTNSDELGFLIGSKILEGNTKRDLFSAIARIFDPLGLLSPFVVSMKMMLQKMWLDKLSWDEPLTQEYITSWDALVKALPLLNQFRIPRLVIKDSFKALELHIFTYASEGAYGACAYVRSIDGNRARIYEKIINSLRVNFDRVYCWTDSTIVLGWLQMLPSKLQPFVRNRVAEVLDKAGSCNWQHVPTDKNPADLISRGVDISTLQGSDLWWHGPDFLNKDPFNYPSKLKFLNFDTLPGTRAHVALSIKTENIHSKDSTFINFKFQIIYDLFVA
ncbi:unnamed protein product, partial [Brenthis ino]